MSHRALPLAALILAALIASPAHADFYVGAAFMQTDAEFEQAADNFDADDSSFKIFAGFNIIKWVGVEAAYRDFGDFSDNGTFQSVDGELEGIDASVRGMLPLGKVVVLFAKAGYANIQYDLDFSQSNDFDDDEWELFYGLGIDINLWKHFGIRAEWEEFDVDDTLNSLSAGGYFRF